MNNAPEFSPLPIEPIQFNPSSNLVVNSAGIPPVYSNNVAVMALQHDMRLIFTEIVTDGPVNQPRVEMRASVSVTPTVMKALHEAIGTTLNLYEEKVNEVTWPPQPRKTE